MSKKGPITQQRTTVIQRTSGGFPGGYGVGGGIVASRSSVVRSSYGGAPTFAAGTISNLSQTGVNQILDTRAREKQDMQGLNERFASYIEKVRFLEAQNKALLIELERCKKMKGFDPSEMKELYEKELEQCKKIIEDLGKEKADFDATLAGLEDKLEHERQERVEAEKINTQLRNDIDRLTAQIGDYEGELASLRGRVDNLEDENKRLKEKIVRQDDCINGLRHDIDGETCKRITAENNAQMIEEDLMLRIQLLEAEIEQYKQLLDKDKSVEIRDVWKNELRKCVSEMQDEYDKKLNLMKSEYENRMDTQMRTLQAGVQRDNMEALQSKEESKKLKSKLGNIGPRMAQLEAENEQLRKQLALLQSEYDDYKEDSEKENDRLRESLAVLNAQMESVLQELQTLQDAKLSLELEIGCYRKLLEGEESKLATLVQEASGSRSKGADALADMIQQQSSGGGGYGSGGSMSISSGGGGYGSGGSMSIGSGGGGYGSGGSMSMNESQGKMTVQKSCRGPFTISECALNGLYIEVENTKTQPHNLHKWRLERMGKTKKTTFEFPDITLSPGQSIRVWGTAASDKQEDKYEEGDLFGNFVTWGTGTCEVKLIDKANTDKATLNMKFNM